MRKAGRIQPLPEAVAALVRDGSFVSLEGFTHLIPFAAGHEVLRQGRTDLTVVRLTPDVLFDQMIGLGRVARDDLLLRRQPRRRLAAPLPRRRRERLAAADRAASSTPTPGWPTPTSPARRTSPSARPARLRRHRPARAQRRRRVHRLPVHRRALTAVRAINPDVAIIHAQQADRAGQRPALGALRRAEGGRARRQHAIVTVEEVVDELTPRRARSCCRPGCSMPSATCPTAPGRRTPPTSPCATTASTRTGTRSRATATASRNGWRSNVLDGGRAGRGAGGGTVSAATRRPRRS